MRVHWFGAAAAIFAVASSSIGLAEPLSFKPDAFGFQFNAAAKRLGVDTRLALHTCKTGGPTCSYQTSTGLYCFAFTESVSTVDSVMCIAGGKNASDDFMMLFTVLPSMFQPPASSDERAIAMQRVVEQFERSGRQHGEAFLHDVTYTMAKTPGLGLMLTADARRR